MNKHVEVFLEQSFEPYSFNALLKKFLKKQIKKSKSDAHVHHQWRSLIALSKHLDSPQIDSIKTRDLKEYIDALWLKYSRGTIIPIVGDIKQFFGWLKKKNYHKKDIARRIRRPKRKPGKIKSAPENSVAAVVDLLVAGLRERNLVFRNFFGALEAADSRKWTRSDLYTIRDLFVLSFLYETGARARELGFLGRAVMESVCKKKQAVYRITCLGKTDDSDYYFTHVTAEIWHVWNQVRPPGGEEYAVVGWRNGDEAKPILTNGISQILVRKCKKLNIKNFRAHSLRHAKGRRSRQLVGLEMTSRLLDHSSLEVTQDYTNIDDPELAEAAIITGIQNDLWSSR